MVFIAPPATVPPQLVLPSVAVSSAATAPHGWSPYTVRAGDTLEGIATRHRTTVGVLVTRNRIRDRHLIMAGTRIQVPRTTAAAKASGGATRVVHTVRAGETLSGISLRYRVPLASLLKTNRLRASAFIHPGQRITVRGAAATAAASRTEARTSGKAATYTVRNGDTLSGIATRYRTTVGAIARASGISARSVIHPGQRLRLPAGARKSGGSSVPDTFNGVKYPRAIAEAAARNRAILAERDVPSRSETKAMIVRTARRHGVDPKLALAIAYQESGWNQRAVSVANAVGVMQVIPSGGQWASSLVGRRLDLLRTQDNITAGVVMLRALGRATDRTEHQVAAYYQGLGALQKHGMYRDTKAYVKNVLALRKTM
jgi:LysM repeat protein